MFELVPFGPGGKERVQLALGSPMVPNPHSEEYMQDSKQ